MRLKTSSRCFIFVMLAVVMIGCNDPNRAKLVGTWELDNTKSLTEKLDVGQDSELVDRAKDLAKDFAKDITAKAKGIADDSQFGKVEIEFLADGTLKTDTDLPMLESKKTGTWEFAGYDVRKRTAQIECFLTNQKSTHSIEFLDNDSIKMKPPNLAGTPLKLVFKRKIK